MTRQEPDCYTEALTEAINGFKQKTNKNPLHFTSQVSSLNLQAPLTTSLLPPAAASSPKWRWAGRGI